jgi:hypothetical protein
MPLPNGAQWRGELAGFRDYHGSEGIALHIRTYVA